MKKFLALLLCLLMIVTCFAACGDKDESTSDVETSEAVEDTTTETKDDKKEGPSGGEVVAGDQDDDNNWTKEY